MPRKKKEEINPQDRIERQVTDQLYNEYSIARRNQESDTMDFEAILDLLECKRTEREYEWMSDVFIPEYPSIHLTEASQWANQYFQTRDFVDVYLSGETPEDKIKAKMVKKLINSTLNQTEVRHFIKYIQLRGINSTRGVCYALCRWEKQSKENTVEVPIRRPIVNAMTGEFSYEDSIRTDIQVEYTMDRFNYDPIDPRNIFTDNKYAYSLQEKEYIIIRDEISYEDLKEAETRRGYFNLDKIKKLREPRKTDTAKETHDSAGSTAVPEKPIKKNFDHLIRFGKMWSLIEESDNDGYPVKTKSGMDELGNIKEGAELIESIVEEIFTGDMRILIRFQPTPYRTSKGIPYRPVIRGLCYIHPTKDVGMSDGKYSRELQVALNDTINMSNDRTKLSTLPTFKGQQNAIMDNDQIYFEPEHVIPLPNVEDLEEFKINPDVRGAMAQAGLFISKMQQVNSIYPTTMGELPEMASTTATAVAGAETRTNSRANYKSLTFENTFFIDFYWMMLQMAFQFMHPTTASKLWGRDARLFDPDGDYSYTPISSNIEQEYSKDRKVQRYDQILSRIASIPNPAIIPIIAYILQQQCILLGAEFQDISPMLEVLKATPNTPEPGPGSQQAPTGSPLPTSNQTGNLMSMQEQNVRNM